jgi:4a-hydroxytetrahydrobiopterin dehydratase
MDHPNTPPDLAARSCTPCQGGVPALKGKAILELLQAVPGWQATGEHHLERIFRFPDFKSALAFVNQIGEVAESEGHHPDLALSWGSVGVEIYTHKVNGLTESDFILAAKISRLSTS